VKYAVLYFAYELVVSHITYEDLKTVPKKIQSAAPSSSSSQSSLLQVKKILKYFKQHIENTSKKLAYVTGIID
jgi:hypothetical protein